MIAQLILTGLLLGIMLYAWAEYRRSPTIGLLAVVTAFAGLCFVWFPASASRLAEIVGIGRGVDLIIYVWVGISLIAIMNLHLKIRAQTEVITQLARAVALAEASRNGAGGGSAAPSSGSPLVV